MTSDSTRFVHFTRRQRPQHVTSLRVCRYEDDQLELREKIQKEAWLAPRLFLPAPQISRSTEPIADPFKTFQEYKQAGYDHIKYLSGLDAAQHETYAVAARKAGIPFFGHLSRGMDAGRAAEYGVSGIEHLQGFAQAVANGNSDEVKRLLEKSAEHRVFHCPTASWFNTYSLNYDDPKAEFTSRTGLEYMPVELRKSWNEWLAKRSKEKILGDKKIREKILTYFAGSGVPMLISHGDGNFFVPGLAMFNEMLVFQKAGFSNHEILKAATYNGADFYGQTSTFGNIKAGLRSDLVLLAANPLENLNNIEKVEGVMLGEKWFDQAMLSEQLDRLREASASDSVSKVQ